MHTTFQKYLKFVRYEKVRKVVIKSEQISAELLK